MEPHLNKLVISIIKHTNGTPKSLSLAIRFFSFQQKLFYLFLKIVIIRLEQNFKNTKKHDLLKVIEEDGWELDKMVFLAKQMVGI